MHVNVTNSFKKKSKNYLHKLVFLLFCSNLYIPIPIGYIPVIFQRFTDFLHSCGTVTIYFVIFVSAMSIFMLLCISHYFCNDTENTIYGCFFLNYNTWVLFGAALNSLLESSIVGLVRNCFLLKIFFVHISVCLCL